MSYNPDFIRRQAVVIIHGMGEQRPNATLRGFVRCLAEQIRKQCHAKPQVYEKPDKVSGTYETRSMVITEDKTVGRPTTHVYEFYWAHHMRDTQWKHILGWLARLIFRKPSTVPRRLRKVFDTIWGIMVATLLIAVVIAKVPALHHIFGVVASIAWVGFLLTAFTKLVQSAIINSLGDAARYMSDSPDNIEQRQKIRQEGIDLLRHLHTAQDEAGAPLFDRIIVASHSLGTVVAYDLLRLMWVEYSETYDKGTAPFENTVLTEMETGNDLLTGYMQKQHDCWKMQRKAGNQWLITDLVTMGAPLTYFDYLIVGSEEEFLRRKEEREYPACPPEKDAKYIYHWPVRRPRTSESEPWQYIKLLSYSSLYACVRWTNLFFTTDFIGGPLRPMLGEGIEDKEIKPKGVRAWLPFPYGHTCYWDDKPAKYDAMDEIAAAIRLNCNVVPSSIAEN